MAAPEPPVSPPPPPRPPVAAIAPLRLPAFWADKPALWFAHAEAQFELHRVSASRTRYSHVLSQLDQRQAAEVEDLLLAPPEDHPYETLKSELVRRLSASEEQRVREIVSEAELGDRRPSQFLRHLKSLAGSSPIQDNLLRQLWLRRLPVQVQGILAVQADVPLDKLAELADKIVEVTPTPVPVVHAVAAAAAPQPDFAALQRQLEALTAKVSSLLRDQRARPRSRSRPASAGAAQAAAKPAAASASSSRAENDDLCWYHNKWGGEATKCRSPCSFAGNA